MYGKLVINFLLILGISITQLSLFSVLPRPFNSVNVIILSLVFILILGGIETALWWAVGAGTVLGFYSNLLFGTDIVALVITIFLINFLLLSYFTNRSLYSFVALTALAVIFNDLFKYIITFIFDIYRGNALALGLSAAPLIIEFKIVLVNIATMVILFYIINYIGQWLKPVFLIRNVK